MEDTHKDFALTLLCILTLCFAVKEFELFILVFLVSLGITAIITSIFVLLNKRN